jgi:hypothetical protein
VACALQADKFGDIFEILPEHELIAAGDHRHIAHAEGEQLFAAAGVVKNVNSDEVDTFFRKKLFRSKAAASAGLGKEDELVVGGGHVCVSP